jgi:hypothetical protein
MIGLTPDITDARVASYGVLSLTFSDGVRGDVDVLDRMRGPVFRQARTLEGFACVTVDQETGTITWPGGADLAPRHALRARANRQLARQRSRCLTSALTRTSQQFPPNISLSHTSNVRTAIAPQDQK